MKKFNHTHFNAVRYTVDENGKVWLSPKDIGGGHLPTIKWAEQNGYEVKRFKTTNGVGRKLAMINFEAVKAALSLSPTKCNNKKIAWLEDEIAKLTGKSPNDLQHLKDYLKEVYITLTTAFSHKANTKNTEALERENAKLKDEWQELAHENSNLIAKCEALALENAKLKEAEDDYAKRLSQHVSEFEKGADDLRDKVNTYKARADLTCKKLAEARVLIGNTYIRTIYQKVSSDHLWVMTDIQKESYQPSEIADIIDFVNLTSTELNKRIEAHNYQHKKDTDNPRDNKWEVSEHLGAEYAIRVHVQEPNGRDFYQLQWTKKGRALIIGTLIMETNDKTLFD